MSMQTSSYCLQETPDLQWNVVKTTVKHNSYPQKTVVESHPDKKAAEIAAQKLSDTTGFPFLKATIVNSDIKINVGGLIRRHKQNKN